MSVPGGDPWARAAASARGRTPLGQLRDPEREPRGGPALAWVAGAMVLAVAFQYGDAVKLPFLGDDYSILDKVRWSSFVKLWEPVRLLSYWYRPWSREFHYWTLERLFGARELPFHLASFALWVALMCLYFGLAKRMVGGRAAVLATAGVAALAAWAGTLVWVAGVQELWMLFWAFVFLHAFSRRGTVLALPALALALLSKETAVALLPVAFAWAMAIDDDRLGAALRRIVPYGLLCAAWAAFHPWLLRRLTNPALGHTELVGRPSILGTAGRFLLSLVNLDERPAPESGWLPALRAGIFGILVLAMLVVLALRSGAGRRSARATTLPDPGVTVVAAVWTVCGALALFVPSIGWHAYYGLLAAFGAWLLISVPLARRPVLAGIVLLAVAVLRPLRADTPSWDWSSKAFQRRAGFFLGRLRDDLLARHPQVPSGSRLYFAQVPQNIGLVSANGPAFRVWYADSSLRAGFFSDYKPRTPEQTQGRDYFFRYDTTLTWVELVQGEEDIDAARRANPEWEADHRMLALTLGVAGDWAGAATEVRKLVVASPQNFEYPLNLGRCYEEMGDLDSARRCYLRAAAMPGASEQARRAPIEFESRLRERGWGAGDSVGESGHRP